MSKNKLNLPNQGHSIYSYCLNSVLLCKLFHYIGVIKGQNFYFIFFLAKKMTIHTNMGLGPFWGPGCKSHNPNYLATVFTGGDTL